MTREMISRLKEAAPRSFFPGRCRAGIFVDLEIQQVAEVGTLGDMGDHRLAARMGGLDHGLNLFGAWLRQPGDAGVTVLQADFDLIDSRIDEAVDLCAGISRRGDEES